MVTPASRFRFWLIASLVTDVPLAALAIGLVVTGDAAGWWLAAFTVVKAALGVAGLVVGARMLADARTGDDRPSVLP